MKLHPVKKLLSAALCLLLAGSVCMPAYAADTQENLIQNPGFEEDFENWVVPEEERGDTMILDKSAHSGRKTVYLGGRDHQKSYTILQDLILLRDGQYELSAYVLYFTDKYPGSISMSSFTQGQYQTVAAPQQYVWQKLSLTFSATEAASTRIKLRVEGACAVLVDDVSLVRIGDIPEPPEPPVPDGGLLYNPSFEDGLSNWTLQGMPCAYSAQGTMHTGQKSILLNYFTNEDLNNCIDQNFWSPSMGTYTFSAYIKTLGSMSGIGAVLLLEARDTHGSVLAKAASPATADTQGGWKQLQVKLRAPRGTVRITAKIAGIYCTGAFYADDAFLAFEP